MDSVWILNKSDRFVFRQHFRPESPTTPQQKSKICAGGVINIPNRNGDAEKGKKLHFEKISWAALIWDM